MARFVAFLRGVNIGAANLKMADVTAALIGAGFSPVRAILASGNVLLESTADAAAVRQQVEATLRESFGYEAWVLVYDLETVRTIVDAYPFEREVDGYQSYVTFVANATVLNELIALADTQRPNEKISPAPDPLGVIYWQVPKGGTLDSTIGQTMGIRRYKSSTTTRNLRTLVKVLR